MRKRQDAAAAAPDARAAATMRKAAADAQAETQTQIQTENIQLHTFKKFIKGSAFYEKKKYSNNCSCRPWKNYFS